MPVYQRDVTSLIQLAPGVLATGAQQRGGGGFQAPGTQTGASSGGGGNLGHSSSIFATENGASANANGGQFGNQRLQHRRYQHRERRLGWIDGHHSQSKIQSATSRSSPMPTTLKMAASRGR